MKRIAFLLSLLVLVVAPLAATDGVAQTPSFTGVWTSRPLAFTLAGGPGGRGWVDLIYDPAAGRPVLFGGSGDNYMNDILQIDLAGNRWVEIEPYTPNVTPSGPPCPRDEHAVEYDALNALYWSFGGSGFACSSRASTVGAGSGGNALVDPSLTQTTVDYYKDWLVTVMTVTPFYVYVTAYDPLTKTLTLKNPFPSDATGLVYSLRPQGGGGTWYYNPRTREWKSFDAPSSGYVGPRPISRLSPAMAYSTRDEAILMFGGLTYNDTWALDAQTRAWVPLLGNGWPGQPPRRSQITNSMVYDSANDLFVLYGGVCAEAAGCGSVPYNGILGDTWVYRLSTNVWTQMTPASSPPPLQQHTLSYDPVNQVVVLFGGMGPPPTYAQVSDVWVYDVPANRWSKVNITGPVPQARRLHAMVYDPGAGEHIVYGGIPPGGSPTLWDVWSLQLTRAGNTAPLASFFISPGTGTPATTFQFDGSASRDPDGSIVSYAWNFGDGATASGVTTTHRYAAIGSYTVRLTVTDNLGLPGSNTSSVSVLAPTSTVLGSSQNPSTVGTSVTFTATVTGGSPTGTMGFTDNGTTIGGCATVALAGAAAQCPTAALTVGNHNIVATYSGDAGDAGSVSPTLSQGVNAAAAINVALAANGGVASASSTYTVSGNYAAASANNGDRKGVNWANGGGWNDADSGVYPDWLQILFSGQKTIGEIDVFTVQDNYTAPIAPTLGMTFGQYGITDFQVQYWTGSGWLPVTGGTVTGNNKVWRQFTFTPVTTDRVRVVVTGALAGYSRITEVEAWGN
ncbi:MAG: PKD domain-containing protein [Aromatoleum sp.]|nr:PKD domain-containing protein [Aromatoleum sp.]